MIDERHEELAALYALDLLEGSERAQFETALVRDPALQALVRELRESSSALAHTAPHAPPPPALKERILASVSENSAPAHVTNVVRPPASAFRALLPWAVAACFAFASVWTWQLYRSSRTEVALLRSQQEIAEVALQTARNQLEAERLLDSRAIVRLNERIADLNLELKSQGDLAELKIAALASMLNNSPEALAVAVWNPAQQEGILNVEKLPALAAGQTYELWVIEDQKAPVSAGVFSLGGDGRGRVRFKPAVPIAEAAVFAVSRETDDGGRTHASPGEVLVLGKSQ